MKDLTPNSKKRAVRVSLEHTDSLVIDPKNGIAYQSDRSQPIEYNSRYLKKIKSKSFKKQISLIRKALVDRFCPDGMVLDYGCGDMSFLKLLKAGYGYDIIPETVEDLGDMYCDPYKQIPKDVTAITMWDSFEHIPEPKDLLKLITNQTVFVSIPIIDNILKVKGWKHYRPNEHFWHYTNNGFIQYMNTQGFDCIHFNEDENDYRKDICTYVFRRKQ